MYKLSLFHVKMDKYTEQDTRDNIYSKRYQAFSSIQKLSMIIHNKKLHT